MLGYRKFWFFAALAIVIIGSSLFILLPSLEKARVKSQTFGHLQQTFNNIPVLAEAKLIHRRYYGCTKCQFAGAMALYATNLSPEDVRIFYRNYLQNPEWGYGGQWEGQDNSRSIQWSLDAQWSFAETDSQEQSFGFLASESKNTSTMWFTPGEATERAMATG